MDFSWDGPRQRMREISLDQTKTQQYDKLVFVGVRPELPVIARPVRRLVVAIPRLEGKCIDNCPTERENLAILGRNRYLAPLNGGIATPVCALVRNDR